jgi:hypothetical protein
MSDSDQYLIEYYRSSAFERDHFALIRRDPAAAEQQRRLIMENLQDNALAIGITFTPAALAGHQEFIAGTVSLPVFLDYVVLYAASIALRWPEQ